MAHRREHDETPRGRHVKTWTVGTAIVVAFLLAVIVAVLTLR